MSGCLLSNDYKCLGFIFPEEAGTYDTQKVPDQYVVLGEPYHFNINQYWEYDYECEDGPDNPVLVSFMSDAREVELYRQGDNIFIIGKKTGFFSATVIGRVELTRNSSTSFKMVPVSFNVEVGTEHRNTERQRATFSSTGKIDSIIVSEVIQEDKALRLTAEYSLETPESPASGWSFYPSNDIDSLNLMGIPLQDKRRGYRNTFYFNPDTLYPFYYGYVQIYDGNRLFGRTFVLDTTPYIE
jgi:hypothetical protein